MTSKQPGGLSVIEQLAAYVVTESFEKLPEATVRAARRAILDTLGVTLAGSVEPTAARVRALIAHRRAPDEATIIGTPLRASVEDAALANGTASHALDYDDLNQSLSGHPSVPILSAALALGERQRASGAALLAAFVAGVEIEAKLGRALNPAHYEIGWHATATLGVFGAAAAAAKLLGLSAERTANALAIAASMASGIKANFGTDCKPLHVGHAARCGIEAALLAEAGFTGNPRALEHGDGFGATHGGGSRPAWELTTAGLGAPHDLVDPGIGVKRFPACASTHQALDATLALAEEHAIDPKAVVAVECGVSYLAPHQLIYDQAATGLQGKFSMPYCVAVALDALLRRGRAAGPHGGTRTVRRGACPPRRRADPHAEGADVRPPGADNPPEPPHAVHRGRDQARRRPAIGAPRAPGEGSAAESADRRGAHHQVPRLRGPRAATRAGGVRSGDGAGA